MRHPSSEPDRAVQLVFRAYGHHSTKIYRFIDSQLVFVCDVVFRWPAKDTEGKLESRAFLFADSAALIGPVKSHDRATTSRPLTVTLRLHLILNKAHHNKDFTHL